MRTLIVFATYSTGTQLVAENIADLLTKHGFSVTIKKVQEIEENELPQYDLILLGSPSWDVGGQGGQPHQHFLDFIKKAQAPLPGKKFAVFGLGDSVYPIFCGAVDHLEEFVLRLQGTLVIPSLRIDGYFFNPKEANQKIEQWVTQLVHTVSG